MCVSVNILTRIVFGVGGLSVGVCVSVCVFGGGVKMHILFCILCIICVYTYIAYL